MLRDEQLGRLREIFSRGNFGSCTDLAGKRSMAFSLYFIGIKGTGMCALAQLLKCLGYIVSGSDVEEHFYTDELLAASDIQYHKGFAAGNLPLVCDLVIHSAAYDGSNPEYAAAQYRMERGELLLLSYPEALGYISHAYRACMAVAGAHGKTTSTLLCSALMKALKLEGAALAGAGAAHLEGNAFWMQGGELLVVEACEYRNHFFHFDPSIVLLTSLEWDHQDFFTTYSMMQNSFRDFVAKQSVRTVVYCRDDKGVRELVAEIQGQQARDVAGRQPEFVPYGFSADGDFAIGRIDSAAGQTVLTLSALPEFPLRLRVPGEHLACNALGALAAVYHSHLIQRDSGRQGRHCDFAGFLRQHYEQINAGLQEFRGASRRSELLGEISWEIAPGNSPQNTDNKLLVLDDYAHHPTAVRKTVAGLKKFYPMRRLVLDFMSHTYSRTMSLHREFSHCFNDADVLILHDIYGSARERARDEYSGRMLWESVNEIRRGQGLLEALYFPQPLDALGALDDILRPGDLFVTMGAGNNRELALNLLLKKRGETSP